MATKTITEQFAFAADGISVDREAGVIRNVRICGEKSRNGRTYPVAVLRRDYAVYEGAKVYFDHSIRDRSVRDVAGWLSDVKPDAQGIPRGTLNLYKSDPNSAKVLEAAERNPNQLGLSHVAECRLNSQGTTVEAIEKIDCVDIVTDPATSKGLFEGKTVSKKITAREAINAVGPKIGAKKWYAFERLFEMDAAVGDMEVDAVDPGDGETDLADALKVLISAIVGQFTSGDMTAEEAKTKFGAFIDAHDGKAAADDDGEGDDEGEEGETSESAKKKPKALTLEDVRKVVKDVFAETAPERPKSHGKTKPTKESAGDEGDDFELPADAKGLMELIRG